MAIDLIEVKVNIELGAIQAETEEGEDVEVFVARVGPDLLFTRLSEDEALEATAGALDVGVGRGFGTDEEFDLSIRARLLEGALDRLSPKRRQADLKARRDGYLGRLGYVDPAHVVYQAPCGEEFTFSRADLEQVLEHFGGP